jgi:hypothetical protein
MKLWQLALTSIKISITMKKITLTLVITFLSIAFYSCQKNDVRPNESPTLQQSEEKQEHFVRKSSITNANNFAQGHNDCLDEIADETGFPNFSCSQIRTIVNNYFGGAPVSGSCPNTFSGLPADYKQEVNNRYSSQSISLEYKDRLIELIDYYTNYSNLSAFESAINSYQNNIVQNNVLTSAEQETLLYTSAIALKSMQYWTDAVSNSQHPWHDDVNPNNLPLATVEEEVWALVDAYWFEFYMVPLNDEDIAREWATEASANELCEIIISNGGSHQ